MTGILEWIAGWILNYLFGKATKAVEDAAAVAARDQARGEINDANVKNYEAAQTEKDRIKSALALLNRSSP